MDSVRYEFCKLRCIHPASMQDKWIVGITDCSGISNSITVFCFQMNQMIPFIKFYVTGTNFGQLILERYHTAFVNP